MTDAQILELVQNMRRAQRAYFKSRDSSALQHVKKLEADVDKALSARFAKQGSLL